MHAGLVVCLLVSICKFHARVFFRDSARLPHKVRTGWYAHTARRVPDRYADYRTWSYSRSDRYRLSYLVLLAV